MRKAAPGQSLVETLILTSLIALGVLSLSIVCSERIQYFIDLNLAVIASPIP